MTQGVLIMMTMLMIMTMTMRMMRMMRMMMMMMIMRKKTASEGVPGINPQVSSDQLPNSPSNLPHMCL